MIKNAVQTTFLGLALILLFSACGGGGSSSPQTPAKAILKVSTANVPMDTLIAGIQVEIILPNGATPSVLNGNDSSGSIVTPGLTSASSYDATTRILSIATIKSNGFASGEFLTVNCNINANASISESTFPKNASIVSAIDPGATISSPPNINDSNDDRSINLQGISVTTGKIYTISISDNIFSHAVLPGETFSQVVSDLSNKINNHPSYTSAVDVNNNSLIHVLTGARTAEISVSLDSKIYGITAPIAVLLLN